MEPAIETVAAVVVVTLLASLHLRSEIAGLRAPLQALLSNHKDALFLISQRADKAEALLKTTLDQLAAFERAVGDKRALESALTSERGQTSYLQERLAETQRAVIGLANPRVEATVAGQTQRAKEPPEPPVPSGPSRWQAANATFQADREAEDALIRSRVAKYNADNRAHGGPADPAHPPEYRPGNTLQPADLLGLAARESGLSLLKPVS